MNKNQITIFRILRVVTVVILLAYIATLFSGGRTSSALFGDVEKAVTQTADMSTMVKAENRMIKRLYGLSSGDYEGISLYYPTTNMGAEEILLVRLSDVSQSDAVVEAVNKRLATQKKSFDGYGEEQTALLNASVIDVQGNYILFVVNRDAKAVDEAFRNSL